MSTDPNPALPESWGGFLAQIRRHELIAFFLMAYAFPWLIWIPFLVLSRNGLGILPFKAPALLLVIIGGFGPTISALVVTGLTQGRAGVRRLLRACIKWRVPIRWYLMSIFLVPIGFLLASVLLGDMGYEAVLHNSPLLISFYPIALIAQVILAGGLGEEPGWRGFALPRMQSKQGPVLASLILGILHVCWHIPLFFVGELTQAHFNFVLYMLIGIAVSVILTWVYNGTGGSLLLVMIFHEAEDTTSALSLRIAPAYLDRTPAYLLVYGVLALVVLLLTRGSLAYKRLAAPQQGSTPSLVGDDTGM
jgi:uncharacterized protein